MAVKLSPIWVGTQFFNSAGNVLAGGKINTYLAGTTTTQQTFTDATGATPNANPIILDSTGRYSNQIWLTAGTVYKFVLTDSANNVILTEDNISGVNDTSSGVTSEWLVQGTPTFISGTSFSVNGNQTAIFTQGRRVQAQINAGFIYGTIISSAFTSVTTVTLVNDSGALDNTLSAVSVGILGETNPSVPAIRSYVARSSMSSPAGQTGNGAGTFITYTGGTNTGGMVQSTSAGTITVPFPGTYLIYSNCSVQVGAAAAVSNINIQKNAANVSPQAVMSLTGDSATAQNIFGSIMSIQTLAANDAISLRYNGTDASSRGSVTDFTVVQLF